MTTTFTSTGGISPYQEHALRYDRWFDTYRPAYAAEHCGAVNVLQRAG